MFLGDFLVAFFLARAYVCKCVCVCTFSENVNIRTFGKQNVHSAKAFHPKSFRRTAGR